MNDGIRMNELIDDILPRCRFETRALLLIGSLAEGLANASSDVDLLAVASRAPRGPRLVEDAFEWRGRPVSVTYISEPALRRRLRTLDRLYVDGGHLTDGVATRIANARILHDPGGVAAPLVEAARRFTPKPETLQEMMRIAFGFLNDALGSRAEGDLATAALMARAGAAAAVDCRLLSRGERNLKPKWHLRRLERRGDAAVLDAYLEVLGLDRLTAADADRILERTRALLCEVLETPSLEHFRESPLFAAEEERGR